MKDRIKRLDTVRIADIVGFSGGNPKNRTDKDRSLLDASLEEHGYVIPIAVREIDGGRYELIDGHGRVENIIAKGRAAELKVLVLDVASVAEGRRVLLSLQHTAEWDFGQLEEFVKEMIDDGTSLDDIARMSGLTAQDLDVLGGEGLRELERMTEQSSAAPNAGTARANDTKKLEEDVVPAAPKKTITKTGDTWTMGDSILICGDCSTLDPARLRLGKLGLGMTSPPYNAGKNVERAVHGKDGSASRYQESDDMDADAYAELLDASTNLLLRSCAVVAINLQSLAANKRVIARWAARFANHLVDRAVWVKTSSQPAINRNVFNSQFEDIYVYAAAEKPKRTIETASFHGTVANVHEGAGAARDNDHADVHGATMPVHLAQWAIEKLGANADYVVDPFGGTGTTLVVASQLGKRCALVERDRSYCDIIVERWQNLTGDKATRG